MPPPPEKNDIKENCLMSIQIADILNWQDGIKEIDPLKIPQLTVNHKTQYPFYGQATINNGIIAYHSLQENILNNRNAHPTILIHSNNQNIVYVQTPFYLKDGHAATSVLQSPYLNKDRALYLMTAIGKVIKHKFNYNAKATKIALKKTEIRLPHQNGQPDYAFMEKFIKAVRKLVIKDVVLWTDKKLDAYRKTIRLE